jgi:hypothetical protein
MVRQEGQLGRLRGLLGQDWLKEPAVVQPWDAGPDR